MTYFDNKDIQELSKTVENDSLNNNYSKPENVNNESDVLTEKLFQLIGGPSPVAIVRPALKTRSKLMDQGVQWNDGLRLKHWTKVSNIEDQDRDWSKEETDYLFDMCRKYDLRFIIIHDRYDFPNKIRTIEDLKERYYSVCKKILQIRPTQPGNNQQDKGAIIALNTYDKVKEEKRKKNLRHLYNRSSKQIAEEESLLKEYGHIEQIEKKIRKESETFNLSAGDSFKRQQQNQHYRTSTSTTTVSEPHSKVEAIIPIHTRCEKFPIGASVRSQKIPVPKQNLLTKVQKTFQECGLGYLPTVPTESVCGKWTELQKAIQNLLDLKKNLEKQENELKTKQATLQKAKSSIIDSSNFNNSL
ncbi:6479_t:CDS:2 [Entrophospora sp. SA101]|nr:16927_t:CDS:2 [Entrophospora sp. SA101]CAJ0824217.1 19848_t:CDS:2 [Entrophospora sp. SA101]CAJ0844494.1 6479_t:CDS:2 [Entrophospora sp. SA101]